MFEKWLTIENAYILRITHINNLKFILKNGITCRNSIPQDPNFKSIGIFDIIEKRDNIQINKTPKGNLSDYIPFYFAPRSPMLYSLWKNNLYQQEDIIYIVSKVDKIVKLNLSFVFSDGHALIKISSFYNKRNDLSKIDWDVMKSQYWNDFPDDNDRKRRRMAEFLVFHHFPIKAIGMIATKTEVKKLEIEQILTNFGLNIPVNARKNWCF